LSLPQSPRIASCVRASFLSAAARDASATRRFSSGAVQALIRQPEIAAAIAVTDGTAQNEGHLPGASGQPAKKQDLAGKAARDINR
jgi:hypothetical protein